VRGVHRGTRDLARQGLAVHHGHREVEGNYSTRPASWVNGGAHGPRVAPVGQGPRMLLLPRM
jgi:hypothetical protein